MLKMLFFYANAEGLSKIQKEFVNNIEILFKGKVDVKKLDIEKDGKSAKIYDIKEAPAIIVEKDGKIVDKFFGLTQELFLKRSLEKNL